MDSAMLKGIVIGGLAAIAVGAAATGGYAVLGKPKYADVVAVKEVTETIETPREQCENVAVRRQAPVQDEHRVAGTLAGGLVGGLLGSTIGGGNGRTLATVAGAAAGGYAGNQTQKSLQQRDVVTTTERRCTTVRERSEKLLGYDVTYRLGGKEDVVRTSFRPGERLPVKDGRVDVTPPAERAGS